MRTYEELTPDEQEQAARQCTDELLTDITQGLRWNDELNQNDMQAAIDRAGEKAEGMRTPWFWGEYIMDEPYSWDVGDGTMMSETVGDALRSMGQCEAEDALYPDKTERIIRL